MPKQYRPIRPVDSDKTLRDQDKFHAYRHGKYGARLHAGIDIYNNEGTAVKASLGGEVVRATGEEGHESYGGLVIIDHTPEIEKDNKNHDKGAKLNCYVYTLYAHLKSADVSLGQKVRQGDPIGKVGNSGNARKMEPHLHFETIRAKEKLKWKPHDNTGIEGIPHRVNPLDFLNGFSLPDECFKPLTSKEMDRFFIRR